MSTLAKPRGMDYWCWDVPKHDNRNTLLIVSNKQNGVTANPNGRDLAIPLGCGHTLNLAKSLRFPQHPRHRRHGSLVAPSQ
jgi:hypothetical protein